MFLVFTVTTTESLRYLSVNSCFLLFKPATILFLLSGASVLKKSSEDLNVSLISTPAISYNRSFTVQRSGAGAKRSPVPSL